MPRAKPATKTSMPMAFAELVKIRQSVRSYERTPVEPEKLRLLIESVRLAPSAPVIAVLTVERPKVITQIGGWIKRREFPLIDIGIAAEHFCLQATELGLGTCMLGWFDERTVKKLLAIPRTTRVGLLITVGYPGPGHLPRPKIRKETASMCSFNSYRR